MYTHCASAAIYSFTPPQQIKTPVIACTSIASSICEIIPDAILTGEPHPNTWMAAACTPTHFIEVGVVFAWRGKLHGAHVHSYLSVSIDRDVVIVRTTQRATPVFGATTDLKPRSITQEIVHAETKARRCEEQEA